MLTLSKVTLRFGQQVFGPFNLRIEHGERIAVLGPSGAGKSTLLKLLSGELRASSGHIQFMERPYQAWSFAQLSQHRAVLPQSSGLAFNLDTQLVIGLGRVAVQEDGKLSDITTQAANLACAQHLLHRRFDTLSGGEQARVQLARIFAQLWDRQHGLILVDEPLAALDPGLQLELLENLDRFATERGHSVVSILHDINHAMTNADRLLMLKNGTLINDVWCSEDVVPALENLYDIRLSRAVDLHGQTFIAPRQRKPINTNQAQQGRWHEPITT